MIDQDTVIDATVDACFDVIDEACEAHPGMSDITVMMTTLDVLAATLCLTVADLTNAPVDEIIERHALNVISLVQATKAKEHNRGQQS